MVRQAHHERERGATPLTLSLSKGERRLDVRGPMALAFLERQLRDGLDRLGRRDLAEAAAGRVTFTDDGSTVYLHLFPQAGWPHKHPGQAFVLAWADYEDIEGLAGFRELVRQGRLAIRDNTEHIARWLERW